MKARLAMLGVILSLIGAALYIDEHRKPAQPAPAVAPLRIEAPPGWEPSSWPCADKLAKNHPPMVPRCTR